MEGESASRLSEGVRLRSKLAGGLVGCAREQRKGPSEVIPRVDLLELAGAEDRVEHRRAPTRARMADEQEVFLSHCARSDAALYCRKWRGRGN